MSLLGILLASSIIIQAQTQTVRGTVKDIDSEVPLIGVTVMVLDTDPVIGASTDIDGQFVLENVPVGRKSLVFSYIGYKKLVQPNVFITAGKEVILEAKLEESVQQLERFGAYQSSLVLMCWQ